MFVISARVKADTATAHLNALERKQLPFAYSLAVNRTAKLVKQAEIDKMRAVFDRPTPYTLNSLLIKRGTKANPTAKVWLKDQSYAGKGIGAEKYLLPQIDGGSRQHKRFEKALQGVGAMPKGYYCIPGKFAQMDNYGNWSRGQIVKILSFFRAFHQSGHTANMTEASRRRLARGTKKKRGYTFVAIGKRQGRRRPGIYQILADGKHWRPIALFVRRAGYSKRFPYFETAEHTIDREFPEQMRKAIEAAIKSAR